MPSAFSPELISRCVELKVLGNSYTKIQQLTGVPRSVAHRRVVKVLGKEPRERFQGNGVIPILKEHLSKLPEKKRDEVERWMKENQWAIYQSDRNHANDKLFTAASERSTTYRETSDRRDFRDVAEYFEGIQHPSGRRIPPATTAIWWEGWDE
jgi:hypothetical protein